MRAGLAAAAAMVMAAATLTGCGSDDPAPPTPQAATTAPAPEPEPSLRDVPPKAAPTKRAITPPATESAPRRAAAHNFPDAVREQAPEIAVDRRDEEIQAIADATCADLANGDDASDVVADARSLGASGSSATDRATAQDLIKLAIDTTCPDQDRRLDEF